MHAAAADVERWLPPYQGQVDAVDDDTCTVEMGGWSYASVIAWLLLFEVDFEVLDPPELADAVGEVAARLGRVTR